jgi:acetyltransferase-like isoleucine patch superfamily enzyme
MKNYQIALRAFFSVKNIQYRIERWGHTLFEHVFWRIACKNIGAGARVHPTASIRNPQNVIIGKNAHVNLNCCVWAGETSKIVLGDDLLMGPCVQLHASRHGMDLGTPMTHQPRHYADIKIGSDVWLCAGSIITAGVEIANGVVVAANAVVTKSITEENVIVAGIPAKIIGSRKPAEPLIT